MEKWRGKVAVVTGASSGIGAAIALDFVQHGLIVINLDRNVDEEKVKEVDNVAVQHGGKFLARQTDISDMHSLKASFKWIEEKFSVINVHVNAAGVAHNISVLDEESEEKINSTIDINFKGTVHCAREAVRLIRKSEDYGMLINIGSMFAHVIPFPIVGNVYAATKFGVRAFTEIVRQELIVSGDEKIRVSSISPGTIKTSVRVTAGWKNTEEFYRTRPHLEPKEVAASVIYLLSTPYNVNVTELAIRPIGEKF